MIIQIFQKPHIVGKNYIATVSGEIFTFWIGAQNLAGNCCDFDGDLWPDELNVQGTAPSTSRQRGAAALIGPLWEGAVGAADWGREKRVASLPPSALRADTSLAEGGEERRILTPVTAGHTGPALQGAAVIQGGQSRPPLQSRTRPV